MNRQIDFGKLVANFKFEGDYDYEEALTCGHINDTFIVYCKHGLSHPHRYILQRVNHNIFKNPSLLMQNVENVTAHIRNKIILSGGDPSREVLTIIKSIDEKNYTIDESGNFWRAYEYIEGGTTYQTVEHPIHFYQSGKAFGKFQKQLSDFPAETLHETIPDFHHTEKRFIAFEEALNKDICGRSAAAAKDIEFLFARRSDVSVLLDLLRAGQLPIRVTHNDTKLNNVVIDDLSGEAICVLDLDTVMPGLSLYDFGDAIRFGASTAAEDEQDLNKVWMDLNLFEEFTKGFLEEARADLTPVEIEYLPFSAKLITMQIGMRFLTDHLNGDTYFKVNYEGHNLDRARTQFKLVSDMEHKMDAMRQIVSKYS